MVGIFEWNGWLRKLKNAGNGKCMIDYGLWITKEEGNFKETNGQSWQVGFGFNRWVRWPFDLKAWPSQG